MKRSIFFSADIEPNAPGLNLVDEDRRLVVAKGYGDSYTELLFELCEEHRIDVLVPAMGCELLLLASARAFFAEIGARIVLPSEKTLRVCLDRRVLRRCCRGWCECLTRRSLTTCLEPSIRLPLWRAPMGR